MEVDARLGACFVARPIVGHEAISRKCLVRQRERVTPAIEAFWSLTEATCGTPF